MNSLFPKTMLLHALAAVVLAFAGAVAATAADPFPTRPVRIVVNTAPGGSWT